MSLSWADYCKLRDAAGSHRKPASVLRVLCSTGLRPLEVCSLTPANLHLAEPEPWLSTQPTKHRPLGRRLVLSREAKEAFLAMFLFFPLPGCQSQSVLPNTQSFRASLQSALRELLSADPSCLSPFSLYSCRHFYASWSYQCGVSSAFIMRQMGHKHWATTLVYLHLPGDAQVLWRAAFTGDPTSAFVPVSAVSAPLISHPGALAGWLSSGSGLLEVSDWFEDLDEFDSVL